MPGGVTGVTRARRRAPGNDRGRLTNFKWREKLPAIRGAPTPLVSYLLYADDHEHMRLMVRDLLQASGHEVALAPDGATALARLREREPDLLILDVSMPGLSGFDVCRAVKDNPFTARIPVLMLTGEGDVERKVEGFEAGADDYLAKPFDPRELRARVTALVRLVRREGDRNPTSGLPGGRAIEDELGRRVACGVPFAVAYLDIDNFKPFNDVFGFATADFFLFMTAFLLVCMTGPTRVGRAVFREMNERHARVTNCTADAFVGG